MGNFSSQETTDTVSEFLNAVNSTVIDIANSSIATCSGTQVLRVSSCGPFVCTDTCNLSFNQSNNSSCSVSQTNVNSITVSFNNDIKNTIKNFIAEQAAQSNGWLATGFNVASEYIATTDELNEQLQNLFNAKISDVCRSNISSLQYGEVPLCGNFKNLNFDFTQDIVSTALVTCVNTNVVKAFESNSILNSFVKKTDQYLAQQNAGLLDFVTTAIIAFAIVAIVGGFFYYYFSGGQRRPEERPPYERRPEEGPYPQRYPYMQRTTVE